MTSELRSALPGFRLRHSLTGDRSLAPQPSSVLGGRTYLWWLTSFISAPMAAKMICNASAVCFQWYLYSIQPWRGILNEVNSIHVKLPGIFKYNPGICNYCGFVINFIGHYMVFTSFRAFRI